MKKPFLIAVLNLTVAGYLAAQVSGSFTDTRDNKTYKTVLISTQTWMAENLNYATSESWCYNDSISYCNTYGRLYTLEAAKTACPAGWHLPTDAEWKTLETELGMSRADADLQGWRGSKQGGQLKETDTAHWETPNTAATNSSGFSALPGGYRYTTGKFFLSGKYGYWWTATIFDKNNVWIRFLTYDFPKIKRNPLGGGNACSVRCVKD